MYDKIETCIHRREMYYLYKYCFKTISDINKHYIIRILSASIIRFNLLSTEH